MSRVTEPHESRDVGGEDPLDDVVATCIESGSDDLESAVERACHKHPSSADEIRRRIELLRKVGLLRPPGVESDERFPERLGEFRLIERLGGGGMGVVFRARQESLGREVALKLIRPEHLYFPQARERFRRETEAAARLQHPGLVPIFTVGEDHGLPFFAMELVRGSTLAEALRELRSQVAESLQGSDLERALRSCAPKWSQWDDALAAPAFAGAYTDSVVRLAVQVADALHHAHSRGVLHRDVKPSNIAVTREGRALLFDFGLASLGQLAGRTTLTRGEIGSLFYMSPEQLRGDSKAVDRRSDLYSLGVTLYEALALHVPYAERDTNDTRRAILDGAPRPLRARNRAVSRDLELVCAKAMELDPARRYDDVAAFARDLRNVLEHRGIEARPAGSVLQVKRWIQRHPLATTAIAAAVALPSSLYWQKSTHARELGRALTEANDLRAAAQREARDARAATDFLTNMFAAVDPGYARGRELSARDVLDEGAKRLETQLADQPVVRARLLNSIGASFASLGDWQRAEDTLARAREMLSGAGADRSSTMAENLMALADLERELGRPAAVEHARQALDLRLELAEQPRDKFETEDRLAETYIAYGMALVEVREFEQADAVYHRALGYVDGLPGDARRIRTLILVNLANLQMVHRRPADALATANQALDLWRSVEAGPDPTINSLLNVIGGSLTALGRFDEARPIFDELLTSEHQLTGESARFAAMLTTKSHLELETGRVDDAIALLERATALFARVTGPTQDNAMHAQDTLCIAYQRAGRWRDAIELYRKRIALIESTAEPSDWRALMNHVRIAVCYEGCADWQAAEDELSEALERSSNVNTSADDGWEIAAAAHLARYLARRGDVAGAQELVARADKLRVHAGLDIASSAWAQLAEGVVAQAAGDLERARAALEPLAALERGPVLGEATPAIARAHLAAVVGGSDVPRARELATSACKQLESQLGSDHPETRAAAAFLASLQ